MSFKTKLYIGFGLILMLISVVSGILLWNMANMNEKMRYIVDVRYTKVNLSTQLKNHLDKSAQSIHDILLIMYGVEHEVPILHLIDEYYEARDQFLSVMSKMERHAHGEEVLKLLAFIREMDRQYNEVVEDVTKLIQEPGTDYFNTITYHHLKLDAIRKQVAKAIIDLMEVQSTEMEKFLDDTTKRYQWAAGISIFLVGILLISCTSIALSVITNLRRDLNNLVHVIDSVPESDEENLPRIAVKSNDEIGRLSSAFNRMAAALEERTRQERLNRQQLQEQHWMKSIVAEVTTGLQGIDDVNRLAEWFMQKVCPILEVEYGVFYMKRHRWMKIASYASDENEVGVHLLNEGEGLIGQCALENRKIIINRPPESYIMIRSGLGQAPPEQITIMPISFEGEVFAVVELASFHEMSQNKFDLLEELVETLGLVIQTIQGHMEVQRLLQETQIYTEELQTQSEELQQQQEELHMLNEKIGEQFKQAEQKNQQLEILKKELEQKNKELFIASEYKSEFLANMSHELRTPLNSLLILSQLLAENKEGNLSDKQLEYAQTIYSSGSDLLHLIDKILDLSKIESGKMEVVVEEQLISDIITSTSRKFHETAKKKGIAFNVFIDKQVEAFPLRTDVLKLQQIIGNLVSNAIKFTEQGSVDLIVRPANKFDRLERQTERKVRKWAIAIDVKDTGIGIADDKLDLIFQSFRQADGTTSRRYGGSGLGLAISKSLAELLGGRLSVVSEEGVGSTFTLLLPIALDSEDMDEVDRNDLDKLFVERTPKEVSLLEEVATATETSSTHTTNEDGIDIANDEVVAAVMASTESKEIDVAGNKKLDHVQVLLIDDDMRNIYALTIALESYGIDVIVAENGIEGIEMLQMHSEVDLILMDIMMPKMDGYEAIRQIRSMNAYKDLPIIALTAKAMKEDRQKCLDAGANDYISKPVQVDQLISLIQVWLYEK